MSLSKDFFSFYFKTSFSITIKYLNLPKYPFNSHLHFEFKVSRAKIVIGSHHANRVKGYFTLLSQTLTNCNFLIHR